MLIDMKCTIFTVKMLIHPNAGTKTGNFISLFHFLQFLFSCSKSSSSVRREREKKILILNLVNDRSSMLLLLFVYTSRTITTKIHLFLIVFCIFHFILSTHCLFLFLILIVNFSLTL